VPDPVLWFGQLQGVIAIGALALFPLLVGILRFAPGLLDTHQRDFGSGQVFAVVVCVLVMAVPATAMGAAFPALARAITMGGQDVGRQVGRLYVANTFAGVVGSLLAGFVLLPTIGVLASVQLLAMGNLAMLLWLLRPGASQATGTRRAGIGVAAIAFGLLVSTAGRVDLHDLYTERLPPGSQILYLSEGATSTVMVADHSQPPVRRIWIQSVWVAGTGGGHHMLGHLSMLHSQGLERGVGIAFGTGQSFASARLHGLQRLDCVDLNEDMIRAGGHWFADYNDRITEQPGVEVYIQDGRSMLARSKADYDALLMEPLQPWYAGAVNLYTQEFYELAEARLRPGGTLTQWMPIDDIPPDMTRSVVATLAAVFPDTRVYLDNFDLWIVGTKGEADQPVPRWEQRVASPAVKVDLLSIGYGDVESILATLMVGPKDLDAYIDGARLLTDDQPFMEFESPRTANGAHYAANVEALVQACIQPLTGFVDAKGAPAQFPAALANCSVARTLAAGLVAGDQRHWEEALQHAKDALSMLSIERTRAAIPYAASFRARQLVAQGDAEGHEAIWQEVTQLVPEFGGGWLNLGLAEARRGAFEEARVHLERAAGFPDLANQAARALAMLPPAP
jgi:hypothetical protein